MDTESLSVIVKVLGTIKFIASFVFVFGIVVFFHELGHFLVAKLFGVKVEEFALGMGPKLFGLKKGETDYKICLFPIGGYIKMSGEEPEEAGAKELSEKDYYGKPPFQRFLITFSGPFMNFVLTLTLFIIIYLAGIYDYPPLIGPVEKGSPAQQAGVKSGDIILSVNNKKIRTFSEAKQLIKKAEKNVHLQVQRDKEIKAFDVAIEQKETENIFGELELQNTIGVDIYLTPEIFDIAELSPASFCKLKPGDRITRIAGQDVLFWQDISRILNEEKGETSAKEFKDWETTWNSLHKNKSVPALTKIVWLTIERDGEVIKKPVVLNARKQEMLIPVKKEEQKDEYIWLIGIHVPDTMKIYQYSLGGAISKGMQKLKESIAFIIKVFKMLFQGKLGKKALGGPIMIGKMIKQTSESGIIPLLIFTAVLSLHLGLINYFPFPALDGGHMAFSVLEMIRRKPLSLKTMEIIQKAGFGILISLIIYVSYQDILRLVGG